MSPLYLFALLLHEVHLKTGLSCALKSVTEKVYDRPTPRRSYCWELRKASEQLQDTEYLGSRSVRQEMRHEVQNAFA